MKTNKTISLSTKLSKELKTHCENYDIKLSHLIEKLLNNYIQELESIDLHLLELKKIFKNKYNIKCKITKDGCLYFNFKEYQILISRSIGSHHTIDAIRVFIFKKSYEKRVYDFSNFTCQEILNLKNELIYDDIFEPKSIEYCNIILSTLKIITRGDN